MLSIVTHTFLVLRGWRWRWWVMGWGGGCLFGFCLPRAALQHMPRTSHVVGGIHIYTQPCCKFQPCTGERALPFRSRCFAGSSGGIKRSLTLLVRARPSCS